MLVSNFKMYLFKINKAKEENSTENKKEEVENKEQDKNEEAETNEKNEKIQVQGEKSKKK